MTAISVAGGDIQDQTTLNVLLNHIDFGMSPREAVTAARVTLRVRCDLSCFILLPVVR